MKITFRFHRSAKWIREQREASGENIPEKATVQIDTSELSQEIRRVLLDQTYGGEYPTNFGHINYDSNFAPNLHGSGVQSLFFDGDTPTPAEIESAIFSALAAIENEKRAAEEKKAERLAREKAIADEWAALPLCERASSNGSGPNYCRDGNGNLSNNGTVAYPGEILKQHCLAAWEEAKDRSIVNYEIARGKKAYADRLILAEFLASIPDDALRGAIKRQASTTEAMKALEQKIEDASPVMIFGDEDDDSSDE